MSEKNKINLNTIGLYLQIMSCDSHAQETKKSNDPLLQQLEIVKGYDFNGEIDYNLLLKNYMKIGFQATHFAKAVQETNRMVISQLCHLHYSFKQNCHQRTTMKNVKFFLDIQVI
jgi:deoxyhypusine synthase